MPDYIRDEATARELARRDTRVAVALALTVTDPHPAETAREKARAHVYGTAALVVVELYRRGHRSGWDGVKACCTWKMALPDGDQLTPQQIAEEMITDGCTIYDPNG